MVFWDVTPFSLVYKHYISKTKRVRVAVTLYICIQEVVLRTWIITRCLDYDIRVFFQALQGNEGMVLLLGHQLFLSNLSPFLILNTPFAIFYTVV